MRAWLLLIAFLPCWFTLLGQQPHEIDNLLSVVRTAAHDSTKIMALCKLSRIDQDKTKKYQYVNEAFTISRNGKWVKGEAWCNGAMGDFYSGSNNAKALEYCIILRILTTHSDDVDHFIPMMLTTPFLGASSGSFLRSCPHLAVVKPCVIPTMLTIPLFGRSDIPTILTTPEIHFL